MAIDRKQSNCQYIGELETLTNNTKNSSKSKYPTLPYNPHNYTPKYNPRFNTFNSGFYKAQILIDYNNWVNNIQQMNLISGQGDRNINKYLLECYNNLLKLEQLNPLQVICQNYIGIPKNLPTSIRNNLSSLLLDTSPFIHTRIEEGSKSRKGSGGQQANVDPLINGEIARILRRASRGYKVENVFLLSGDVDFLDIAKNLLGEGIKVTFIGSPPCLSNKIIKECERTSLQLITLDKLLNQSI